MGFLDSFNAFADPLDLTGSKAKAERADAQSSTEALSREAMGMQQDWMDYVQREYAPYSEVAGEALTAQRGLSGLSGGDERQLMIGDIQQDPLYQAKVAAGDEAVLRNASATGGLRSGSVNANLAQMSQELLGREIDSRYQKFAGLSGMGFSGQEAGTRYGGEALGEITGTMGNMGSGIMANVAAGQQADANKQSGVMGLAGGIISAFSDERLKTHITEIGTKHGMPWYSWVWNKTATEKFGLTGNQSGHMATDVALKRPDLVGKREGYRTVNYGGLN